MHFEKQKHLGNVYLIRLRIAVKLTIVRTIVYDTSYAGVVGVEIPPEP